MKLKEVFETISPILIKPTSTSLTIGLSKRFLLFELMNKIIKTIEEDPYLNFISLLKNYKVLGRFLYGTVGEFYRDRNKLYFKNFFFDKKLYELVKVDVQWLYRINKEIRMTITKRGIIIYDNYRKNSFNVLLLTSHSGTWIPKIMEKKLAVPKRSRWREEDVDTHRIYSQLILEKGGIWIDNKQSRFICDFNRSMDKAIYASFEDLSRMNYGKDSKETIPLLWKELPTQNEANEILASYHEFYFTLKQLVDSYHFNIIFDGHSMKNLPGRPNISFGTKFIPKFYMPIVIKMQRKLVSLGYNPVLLDDPYGGGFILEWFSKKFPHLFIFSMEINKKIYMSPDMVRTRRNKIKKLANDITKIFDIGVENSE
jgi:N-formylglutamate amidohydrolase